MPVAGPRLDTPSAIGDEGRPRATSLSIAAVIVVLVAGGVGIAFGQPRLFAGLAMLIGLACAGLAFLDQPGLKQTVLGHLLFLPVASVVLLGFLRYVGVDLFLALGITLAIGGVCAGWMNVVEENALTRILGSSVLAYVFAIVGLILVSVVWSVVWIIRASVQALAGGTSPGVRLVGLLGILSVVSLCLLVALSGLPIVELSPFRRRSEARARVAAARRRLVQATVGCFGLAMLVAVGLVTGLPQRVLGVPPIPTVLAVFTSPFVLYPVLGVAGIALLVAAGGVVARKSAVAAETATTRTVGAAMAAAGYLILLGVLIVGNVVFGSPVTVLAILVGAPLLPLVVFALLAVIVLALYLDVYEERTVPVALTATGLVLVGVGAATLDLPAVLTFGAVAGGMVAWDVGNFGLGLTVELGHIPETRRLEVYHAVFTVGVGLVAVLGAIGLDVARRSVGVGIGAPAALALAVVGILLLLIPLRG